MPNYNVTVANEDFVLTHIATTLSEATHLFTWEHAYISVTPVGDEYRVVIFRTKHNTGEFCVDSDAMIPAEIYPYVMKNAVEINSAEGRKIQKDARIHC